MAKDDIYGRDPVDDAEGIASEGLGNKVVLDINGVTDSRAQTHADKSMDEHSETHQDGAEEDISDMRGT